MDQPLSQSFRELFATGSSALLQRCLTVLELISLQNFLFSSVLFFRR